ncbi:MAG: TROVE domain-containing protein [Gemmatimonadales bacterium]
MDFTQHIATRLQRFLTPQREPIPGTDQVPNSAGGYVWPVNDWVRLDRFLVLGTEGGTYYIGEKQLTIANAEAVTRCVAADGPRVVARIVEVSEAGRAPKNDPALFALALAAGQGDSATKAAAWAALPRVARTGTHLLHWLQYVTAFRGWGRGVRRAVAAWYTTKAAGDVAYQVLKYQRRDRWAHRDALRLSHPRAPSVAHDVIFRYATRGWHGVLELEGISDLPVMHLIEALKALPYLTPDEAARTIAHYRLTREMVPNQLLRHAEVWQALLLAMPMTAMIRNLGVMGDVGLLEPGSLAAEYVAVRLGDREALRGARVHPVALLAALRTYARGRGVRGKNVWSVAPEVVDALDAAFHLAFDMTPCTGKRMLLALDVSGSMMAPMLGLQMLTCREGAAAMAMVTAAREPEHRVMAFTDGAYPSMYSDLGCGLTPLAIDPDDRLDHVLKRIGKLRFGGTDCAVPMREALKHEWPVDVFVIYTDNETWAGKVHPAQALQQYRARMDIPAKLVVVAMASNGFSIANPDDAGMLDVVGFDAATPALIADFAAN